jgi:hypothetical protein
MMGGQNKRPTSEAHISFIFFYSLVLVAFAARGEKARVREPCMMMTVRAGSQHG